MTLIVAVYTIVNYERLTDKALYAYIMFETV
jgi:hypothetical protein